MARASRAFLTYRGAMVPRPRRLADRVAMRILRKINAGRWGGRLDLSSGPRGCFFSARPESAMRRLRTSNTNRALQNPAPYGPRRLTSPVPLSTIRPPMRLHPESLARAVPTLVVMCTRPRLGSAKSRPAAGSDERTALDLSQALIDCAIEDAQAWAGSVVLALAQPNDLQWAGTVARGDWSIVGQAGGNTGERINAVDQVLRRHGARELVFVGTTAALQPQADYATVRDRLASTDTVVMPTPSGSAAL